MVVLCHGGVMIWLLMAVTAFLVTHTIPALPRVRRGLITLLGWRAYMVAYSLVSIGVVIWVGVAYRQAPYVEVWAYDPRLFWLPVLLMPFSCIAMAVGALRPNPLSVSFYRQTSTFDAQRPGLLGLSRHPLLWGFLLWALLHMVANGDVASLVMFGLLAVLSAAGMKGLDAKRRRALGGEEWARLTQNAPLWPGRCSIGLTTTDKFAVLIGFAIYAALLALHPLVIGVSPLPAL
jgi:uncharacterized membrane protein